MGMQLVKLSEIKSNPHRTDEAYKYDQGKIDSLKDILADPKSGGFWENILARKTKTGVIQIAYGHHRIEALRQLVEEGMEQYKEIRLNVRPESQLSNETMLKIFIQENKDDWRDIPQNLCMSLLQVKAHLTNIMNSCKDVGEFMTRIGDSAPALKMDARAFARAKNSGIGASTIAQFLGSTWSRQTIQDALQLIEAGEQSEELRKLAETLPNVTLAHRFSKLVTKSTSGKGKNKQVETFDDKTQQAVAKKIVSNDLTRADVEEAIKIVGSQEDDKKDPLAAVDKVIKDKKAAIKKAAEANKQPAPPKRTAVDRVNAAFDTCREVMEKVSNDLSKDDLKVIATRIDQLQDVLVSIAEAPATTEAEAK